MQPRNELAPAAVTVSTMLAGKRVVAGFYRYAGDGLGCFAYDREYISTLGSYPLDPVHLPLDKGICRTSLDGGLFGALADTCAQDWGKRVMKCLPDADRYQAHHMHSRLIAGSGSGIGALRFTAEPYAQQDSDVANLGRYQVTSREDAKRLVRMIANIQSGTSLTEEEADLVRPGVRIGGAHPKFLVSVGDSLWIAKYGHPADLYDIPAIEYTINRLASKAGIRVAEVVLDRVHQRGTQASIFITRRFDQKFDHSSVHYISAATVVGVPRSAREHVPDDLASYQAIARVMGDVSISPEADRRELFRRMVFNVVIGNRDDHLCNHGFLMDEHLGGYRLSPAFDMALDPETSLRGTQAICVGVEGRTPTLINVLSNLQDFGIDFDEAVEIVSDVVEKLSTWREDAIATGLGGPSRDFMGAVVMHDAREQLQSAIRRIHH